MDQRKLTEGDRVRIPKLGKTGTVQRVVSVKRVEVLVENIRLFCKESELVRLESEKKKARSRKGAPTSGKQRREGRWRAVSIDLHGKTVREVEEIVPQAVSQACLRRDPSLDIVHGRGTGKLKAAVHSVLRGLEVVSHFAVLEHNPGVTRVYLT